jgi:heptosyltransferase I
MTARLLVARLSALGDIVFAVPAVTELRTRFPDAQIDWLVEDRFEGLVRSLPMLDQVHVFPRKAWKRGGWGKLLGLGPGAQAMRAHLARLRQLEAYDAILDFQGNLKSSMQLKLVRGALRIGFERGVSKEGAHRRYDLCVPDPGRVPRAQRDFELVRALLQHQQHADIPEHPPHVAAWPLQASALHETRAAIEADVPDFVLLHHGFTAYGRDKEWPVEHWGALCQKLRAAGLRPRLLWTPGERDRAEQILIAAAGTASLAPATPSLDHLMALLDAAQLTIGTDSGPLHLAALRGNRVLALYGPTDPVRFAPPGPLAKTVRALSGDAEPPARDRSKRAASMDALLPEQVYASAQSMLG